jgi:signal transduction histidine kinase
MFSVLIILIYQVASMVARSIWEDYVVHSAGQYFAEGIVNSDYTTIDISKIEKIGGFLYILDKNFRVVYVKGNDTIELNSLTPMDISLLVNGNYEGKQGNIYASMKNFMGNDGEAYVCLAGIPADKVQITSTILNVFDIGSEFFGIILLTLVLFLGGYWATVLLLSRQINVKITKPIYVITEALGRVREGEYNARLELEAENEFIYIRDAFNYMIQELNHLKQENIKEIECRTRLLSDIGHDIKTPITIIQGYLSAILNGDIKDDGKKNEYLGACLNNTMHLSELMQMLLDYTKFERADYELNLKSVEITEFVRKIIIDYYKILVDKDFTIEINISDEEIYAEIDEKEMRRAIGNVINNAIVHNNPGTKLNVSVSKSDTIILVVADTGYEIPDSLKTNIFEPFVCGEASRSDCSHNGLGLSIVSRIIQKHHGDIRIEDNWMGYTKAFVIEIPL